LTFTLLLFNPTSKLAKSKSISCGKMPAQQVKLTVGGLNVNELIQRNAVK
jgi:hypothetical protein